MARKADFTRQARQLDAGKRSALVSGNASSGVSKRAVNQSLREEGRVVQREIDAAVKASGGRGSAAVGEARAIAQLRGAMKNPGGEGRFTLRGGAKALASVGSKNAGQLIKGALRGVLSPAGVSEGVALDVAGRTAKPAREKMQERGVQKVEKVAPKTAAAMRKARVTKA